MSESGSAFAFWRDREHHDLDSLRKHTNTLSPAGKPATCAGKSRSPTRRIKPRHEVSSSPPPLPRRPPHSSSPSPFSTTPALKPPSSPVSLQARESREQPASAARTSPSAKRPKGASLHCPVRGTAKLRSAAATGKRACKRVMYYAAYSRACRPSLFCTACAQYYPPGP